MPGKLTVNPATKGRPALDDKTGIVVPRRDQPFTPPVEFTTHVQQNMEIYEET